MITHATTRAEAYALFHAAGLTVDEPRTWHDPTCGHMYLFSVETFGPATYGHPRMEVVVTKSAGVQDGDAYDEGGEA